MALAKNTLAKGCGINWPQQKPIGNFVGLQPPQMPCCSKAKSGICVGLSVCRKNKAGKDRAFAWDRLSAANYMDFAWDNTPH
jgi:hypothetical protein